ncbi:MAG: MarR family transcriptional regulator [Xanthomonadales bacterium]|nr:MarR family transcriptional regulator [Xanthomonadales bacterium]NIX12643.1 MarR family transcriptional regulator [Xanthomonadales bacterium]
MNEKDNPPDDFALEEFLPYRLSLISNTVSQGISSAYRKQFSLSITEWRVVAMLGRFPGLTASEVMQRTAMDKVAVSRAVHHLLDKGLLVRTPHEEDRRRQLLHLAPGDGVALFNEVVPKALEYERQFVSSLSDAERERFSELLNKLQAAAERLNRGQS